MSVRWLWLREKLYWKLYANNRNNAPELFQEACLEFANNVRLKLEPTDVGHQQIAYTGFIEYETSRRIAQLAKTGGLMVDVGANYGYYACLWASLNPTNEVTALEAGPPNVEVLKQNVAMNGLATRVTIMAIAAGKEPGVLPFSISPQGQTGWGGLSLNRSSDTIEVQVDTLDRLFSEIKTIRVLKIDTEGADAWVLEGAHKLLSDKRIEHIFFELNQPRMTQLGIDFEAATKQLNAAGYRVEHISGADYYACLE